jgi:esterase/lipase
MIVLAVLALLYVTGPHPTFVIPDSPLPEVPVDAVELELYISHKERRHIIKPDNEARIIWHDSLKRKTPYSLVYLHGFRASQKEAYPIHEKTARTFGFNLYMNRLPEHGIDTTDALINLTAEKIVRNVKEALAIGKAIGDNVILMSTSTGGTAALYLAANFPDDVHALINLSPNIELRNPSAIILNKPWGISIAKLINGGQYMETEEDSLTANYWTPKYRIEALAQLQEFVTKIMTPETFGKISAPSLTLYYYKNEQEQDPTLKVSAMLRMHEQLATPPSLKMAVAIPNAGAHVIGSELTSKDVEGVYRLIEDFLLTTLKLEKKSEAPKGL